MSYCTLHCTECTSPHGHRRTRQTHIVESTGVSGPDGRPGQISVFRFPPAPQDERSTRGLIFQASLSFWASSAGTPLHTIAHSTRWRSKTSRNLASGSSWTWLTFHRPDSRTRFRSACRPSQPVDESSISCRLEALSSAIAPASITPRSLIELGGSSTSSQRNGIAPMC